MFIRRMTSKVLVYKNMTFVLKRIIGCNLSMTVFFYHTWVSHYVVGVGEDLSMGVGKDSGMGVIKTRAWYMSGSHLISWHDI